MSCAGQIMPPEGYFKQVYKHCRDNGTLCIADEVQVGFGRVGSHMWAYELGGVIPDIVTVGKPIANGFPIAAVITRREIAEAYWKSGSQYFNTFGGNAVACAAAEAVLDIIEDEDLKGNALKVGNHILEGVRKLRKEYPQMISDIRGYGLFIGIEMLTSDGLPNSHDAYRIRNALLSKKIIISVDGPDENVLKIKSPMCVTIENAEQLLKALAETLNELC